MAERDEEDVVARGVRNAGQDEREGARRAHAHRVDLALSSVRDVVKHDHALGQCRVGHVDGAPEDGPRLDLGGARRRVGQDERERAQEGEPARPPGTVRE